MCRPCSIFLFRLEAMAISWSAMFHFVILSWLGPGQCYVLPRFHHRLGQVVHVSVSVTIKAGTPSWAWWKEWNCLAPGQASGLEAPSLSAPTARDIIPPVLLCTTHVTRLNSLPPVNNSPCLRYTTLEPHHGHTANENTEHKTT